MGYDNGIPVFFSLPLFSLCRGWGAARILFTASSDRLVHPPLSLVAFFQSSSSPAFLTSLLTQSPISALVSLVSSCPPRVTLPPSSAVCYPPSFLRVLPTVVCSSSDSLSSSSALPSLPLPPPCFSCLPSLLLLFFVPIFAHLQRLLL